MSLGGRAVAVGAGVAVDGGGAGVEVGGADVGVSGRQAALARMVASRTARIARGNRVCMFFFLRLTTPELTTLRLMALQ